jgi:hypothetical protein
MFARPIYNEPGQILQVFTGHEVNTEHKTFIETSTTPLRVARPQTHVNLKARNENPCSRTP